MIISLHNQFKLKIFCLSTLVVFVLFIWEGHTGFNLWDEGFLWYGAQRVMKGEVPIRDFMAYDPGRYYWSATLMHLWGNNGIISLRFSVAVFQVLGLFSGLYLIARSTEKQKILYILLSTVTLTIWMFPRHKLFDISLSIILISTLTFLVESPTLKRYFLAGLCVGIVSIFGRNHGIYGAIGSVGTIFWLHFKQNNSLNLIKKIMIWIIGVIIGIIPILCMIWLVPNFGVALWKSILYLFESKTTNLTLPIPWPWLVNFHSTTTDETIRQILVGLFFMATIGFGISSIIYIGLKKNKYKLTEHAKIAISPCEAKYQQAIVATAFLALPYAHHAYSRADVGHLAQGIFPLLIGCLVILAKQPPKLKWPFACMLCIASLWVSYVSHPGWQCLINKCVNTEISGSQLLIDKNTASDIQLIQTLAKQYAPNNQTFITTPFWPGAYALLQRKAPMWEIYALLPRSYQFEQEEISRIKQANPRFALIFDLALDGQEMLRFQYTHQQINQYIFDNFEKIPNTSNPAYHIFKAS